MSPAKSRMESGTAASLDAVIPAKSRMESGTAASLDAVIPAKSRMESGTAASLDAVIPAKSRMESCPPASPDSRPLLPTTTGSNSPLPEPPLPTASSYHLLYKVGILTSPGTRIRIGIRRKLKQKEISAERDKRAQLNTEIKRISSLKIQDNKTECVDIQEGRKNLSLRRSHALRVPRSFWKNEDFLPTCIIDSSSDED